MKDSIEALLEKYPDITQSMVADVLGVSRQRVHQVCRKHGIELKDGREHPEFVLGAPIVNLYRLFDKDGKLLYVGVALNTIARLTKHKNNAYWFRAIRRVEIEPHNSMREALMAEAIAIRDEEPFYNRSMGNAAVVAELELKT